MASPRTPAGHTRAKLAAERQRANREAQRCAEALRDLTSPGFVEPQPSRRQISTLVHAWAEAMKRGLKTGAQYGSRS